MNTLGKYALFVSIQMSAIAAVLSVYSVHETERLRDSSMAEYLLLSNRIGQLENSQDTRMAYDLGVSCEQARSSTDFIRANLDRTLERYHAVTNRIAREKAEKQLRVKDNANQIEELSQRVLERRAKMKEEMEEYKELRPNSTRKVKSPISRRVHKPVGAGDGADK